MKVRVQASRRGAAVLILAAALVFPLGAQENASPQQPVFRTDVDLIKMDVSVIDRNRRPIRGLTAEDFTVTEDGRPQRVVAVSSVDLGEHDPVRSARMRYVSRDVAANDLSDQLGDGRLIAIVFDDVNLPADDPDIVRAARDTARYIVDRLGPSDMVAIVYAHNSGRTQDFTSDRSKLLDAIDRFQPARLNWIPPTPSSAPQTGGGALQQWSPILARSWCMRNEPAVPTLDTVASRLATAPGRRKAVMFISVGVPLSMSASDACGRELTGVMTDVFRKAQRDNVNIYGIDPAGLHGYRQYLERTAAQRAANDRTPGRRRVPRNIRVLQEFLRVTAENTGGRAIVNTNAIEAAVDQILQEDRAYYIVGYESSNGAPDGKFRRVSIRVNRPGASVRNRSGYWASTEGSVVDRRLESGPTAENSTLAGLGHVQGVPLRVAMAPIARAQTGPRDVDVAVVLSVRYPSIRAAMTDTLTITRNIYDTEGRTGPPVRVVETAQIEPSGGDETRHDVIHTIAMEPGRRQVRFHVQSALLDTSGTVYADIDIPDFSRSTLALSGLVVSSSTQAGTRSGGIDHLVPIVPTSSRDFSLNDVLTGFVRIYQASDAPAPITVTVEVSDTADQTRYQTSHALDAAAFEPGSGASYQFEVPLAQLAPGPHLLSVTARMPGGRTARRDMVFRVR